MSFEEQFTTLMETRAKFISTDLQIVMRSTYETAHGIMDHDAGEKKDHPFGLVLMHPNEDPLACRRLRERLKDYVDSQIHKYFGLSFTDFLDQPTYLCDMQLADCNRRMAADIPKHDAAMAKLKGLI